MGGLGCRIDVYAVKEIVALLDARSRIDAPLRSPAERSEHRHRSNIRNAVDLKRIIAKTYRKAAMIKVEAYYCKRLLSNINMPISDCLCYEWY